MNIDLEHVHERLADLDWTSIERDLDERGWATTGSILTERACRTLAAAYDDTGLFRSRVVMARHGFGRGEYQYFGYPLPHAVETLRSELYRRLVPTANRWLAALRAGAEPFPAAHSDYIDRCHAAGQVRPTPLLLRYGVGDYNCLHQDLYGAIAFPLQAAFLLSDPERDFTGGEFVLTEQRPRMQSKVHVVPLGVGEAVIFAVNHRPVTGARGSYRVTMRHGVSPLRKGQRHTLGIILHDAA